MSQHPTPEYGLPNSPFGASRPGQGRHRGVVATVILVGGLSLTLIACAFGARFFGFRVKLVMDKPVINFQGTSMRPALNDGDRIQVDTTPTTSFERGEIVVFYFPDDPSKSFVKRIIGLPGEMIKIDTEGIVYINSARYNEPYLNPQYTRFPRPLPETYIKPHYYFVMGDDRDASNDCRSWGLVPKKYIYAKFIKRVSS